MSSLESFIYIAPCQWDPLNLTHFFSLFSFLLPSSFFSCVSCGGRHLPAWMDQFLSASSRSDALAFTGDGHEEQPFVTDKKENDLSGYERNLYLYHVSIFI